MRGGAGGIWAWFSFRGLVQLKQIQYIETNKIIVSADGALLFSLFSCHTVTPLSTNDKVNNAPMHFVLNKKLGRGKIPNSIILSFQFVVTPAGSFQGRHLALTLTTNHSFR